MLGELARVPGAVLRRLGYGSGAEFVVPAETRSPSGSRGSACCGSPTLWPTRSAARYQNWGGTEAGLDSESLSSVEFRDALAGVGAMLRRPQVPAGVAGLVADLVLLATVGPIAPLPPLPGWLLLDVLGELARAPGAVLRRLGYGSGTELVVPAESLAQRIARLGLLRFSDPLAETIRGTPAFAAVLDSPHLGVMLVESAAPPEAAFANTEWVAREAGHLLGGGLMLPAMLAVVEHVAGQAAALLLRMEEAGSPVLAHRDSMAGFGRDTVGSRALRRIDAARTTVDEVRAQAMRLSGPGVNAEQVKAAVPLLVGRLERTLEKLAAVLALPRGGGSVPVLTRSTTGRVSAALLSFDRHDRRQAPVDPTPYLAAVAELFRPDPRTVYGSLALRPDQLPTACRGRPLLHGHALSGQPRRPQEVPPGRIGFAYTPTAGRSTADTSPRRAVLPARARRAVGAARRGLLHHRCRPCSGDRRDPGDPPERRPGVAVGWRWHVRRRPADDRRAPGACPRPGGAAWLAPGVRPPPAGWRV